MKRLAIFAHYDARGEVKRYVVEHLRKLRPLCQRLEFVSTGALSRAEQRAALRHCDGVSVRENVGFDFSSWQSVLQRTDLSDWDEIVLTNSSVFGPLGSGLADAFERMDREPVGFWGMTDNVEVEWHLQSYFLVFRKPLLRSRAFEQFWSSVLPFRNKWQVIRSYEVGLTSFFCEAGFTCAPLVSVRSLIPSWWVPLPGRPDWRSNPTCWYPERLLDLSMPYVKVELLRDNPFCIPLAATLAKMQAAGYDLDLIEFDRTRPRGGLAKLMAQVAPQLWDTSRS